MSNWFYAAVIDVLIQLVGFVIAFSLQTEKFYDLTGSLTFILLAQLSLRWKTSPSSRQTLTTTLVTIWAVRLGLFLFYRVFLHGGDVRFDKVKTKPVTFFIYWIVQGVWVFVTLLPTFLLNNKTSRKDLSLQDYVGLTIWIIGFLFEVVADYQKFTFKKDPNNAGKFINTGLWSISRHPNYFGEILMWIGIFVIASSVFSGMEWLSVLSPLFVYYLLSYVSGIPILERLGKKRYGSLETYKHYLETVPVLVPFLGSTT